MFGNKESMIKYPITDHQLPFSDYIARTRAIIETYRVDLQQANAEHIIQANCPFELYPPHPITSNKKNKKIKYGVLMLHGLLDSPFSFAEIGAALQAQGILCRSILLPGHGTTPEHLFSVSYHDWIKAMQYGVESLRQEVDHIYLMGYSTGAALATYHALHAEDELVAGVISLAPALRIRGPVEILTGWQYLKKQFRYPDKQWLFYMKEQDYAKYNSITINAVTQVAALTNIIKNLRQHHKPASPMLVIATQEDETISTQAALQFFSRLDHPDSKFILYSAKEQTQIDSRIITRNGQYPQLNIEHLSHISIPFSAANSHYGMHGDYKYASHANGKNVCYGAYNYMEMDAYNLLYKFNLVKNTHQSLTYNPDFDFMIQKIQQFILGSVGDQRRQEK
jgi:esterase/lipase